VQALGRLVERLTGLQHVRWLVVVSTMSHAESGIELAIELFEDQTVRWTTFVVWTDH